MSGTDVEVPLFPLRTVLFPDGPLPLRIFETRYLDMVGRCLKQDLGFGVVASMSGVGTDPDQIQQIGTLARIVDWYQFDDGLLGITAIGETRFLIKDLRRQSDGLNLGRVEFLEPESAMTIPDRFYPLLTLLETMLNELEAQYRYIDKRFEDASWVGCRLAELLPLSLDQKQVRLEVSDPVQRLEILTRLVEALKQ